MSRRSWIVVALVLIVAAVFVPRFRGGKAGAARPAVRTITPPRVEVYVVKAERLAETLVTPGTLQANERTEVVSEIAGKVERILFDEGTKVVAGELLLKIDDRELVAEKARIVARLDLAQRRTVRQEELHADGLISDDQLETVSTEADVLRAELGQIEARLAKTEIRAPFSGIVGLRKISPGAYISPQTPIASLVETNPIKLDFSVPERHAALFVPGRTVGFTVEGVDGVRRATIFAVEPNVDPDTRTVPMRARCGNADGRLVPGGFADVTLDVRVVEQALTVPSIAVIPELGGKKVFVEDQGIAQPRQVETGIRTGDRVEVTSGLVAGERVIVSGLQFLRAGIAVEVTGEGNGAGEHSATGDLSRATL